MVGGRAMAKGESPEEKRRRARQIITRLKKAYPDAKLALNFSNPLELLIALILAAQCTDERVNGVTAKLFKKYRTAAEWARIPRARLQAEIRTTGFYRNKAKAIQECCTQLARAYDGQVPDDVARLVELPGVGRKTANILVGNAFGRPAIGVDTHVGRLAQRLALTHHTDPDKIEEDLVQVVPKKDWVGFCHLLQEHGRRICLARKPNCPACPVNRLCPYPAAAGIRLS